VNNKIAYFIPNFFTAGSLICALMALQVISNGQISQGCWLLTLSILFDGLDGKMARWLNATSKIGAQADSLADFVAFGVVPGFLAWVVSLNQFGTLGFIIFVIYVLCGGYRLARFNVMSINSTTKEDFKGLPIPAAAAAIVSFILFNELVLKDESSHLVLPFILCFLSWLMVSKIPYVAMTRAFNKKKITTMVITLIVILVYWAIVHTEWVYLIVSWVYICYGLYNKTFLLIKKQQSKRFLLKNKK